MAYVTQTKPLGLIKGVIQGAKGRKEASLLVSKLGATLAVLWERDNFIPMWRLCGWMYFKAGRDQRRKVGADRRQDRAEEFEEQKEGLGHQLQAQNLLRSSNSIPHPVPGWASLPSTCFVSFTPFGSDLHAKISDRPFLTNNTRGKWKLVKVNGGD